MKRLGLLIGCLLIAFTTFSQALRPTTILQDNDTLFCFTIAQSKDIAKRIVGQIYCDSIQLYNTQIISIQDSIINTKKSQIANLRHVIKADNAQILNLTLISDTYRRELVDTQAELKRIKKMKWLYIGIGGLSGIVVTAIVK